MAPDEGSLSTCETAREDRDPSPVSPVARPATLSHKGLRCAHVSELPTEYHLLEAVPTSSHGDGARRPLGSITGPPPKAGNDPGKPGDGVLGVRVLLLDGLAFERDL